MSIFSPQVLGVDIGHASLRLVGLTVGRKPQLVGCKELMIPIELNEGWVFKDTGAVAKILRQAMAEAAPKRLRAGKAYAALPEAILFRKVLELPLLTSSAELIELVRVEVAQYLPDPIETMQIDFQVLGEIEPGKTQQVMVVAASLKVIESYLAVFRAAHLELELLEPRSMSLARAMGSKTDRKAVLILDSTASVTTLAIYDQGLIRVNSTLNLGTKPIYEMEKDPAQQKEMDQKIKELAVAIGEEIEHVLKFYSNRAAGRDAVEEIYLVGSGSLRPAIKDAIQGETELKVKTGQPVIPCPAFCDRRYLAAIGVALYPSLQL